MLDPVYYLVSGVMWFWHQIFGALLGPSSGAAWALSVMFLVLTLRAIMIRPFLAQVRSGRAMQALAPQLAQLRARHGGDPTRLAEETRALHRAHGVSPLGGCLPALLQLPVFVGLLHVLRSFNRPGLTFEQNAAIANYAFPPEQVRSFLEARLFGTPLSAYVTMPQNLLDSFGAHVERWEVLVVAVPLMVVAAVATHVTARHALRRQPPTGQTASIMRWTPWVFPMGVLVSGALFPFPLAILLYWLTNNAWTLVQQHLVYRTSAAPPGGPVESGRSVESGGSVVVGGSVVSAGQVGPVVAAPGRGPGGAGRAARPRRNSSGHRPRRRR